MIITVTLNPSLDRTIELDHLAPGCVQRVTAARLDPGGKGVNVARALLANGVPTRAVVPVAGVEGDQLVALLEQERVDVAVVPVLGHTRSNITIAEADGTVTKLNEPGASLSTDDLEALTSSVLDAATPGSWVVPEVRSTTETATATAVLERPLHSIVFACDAGMGSSVMGASVLRSKLKKAGIEGVTVVNQAVADLKDDADLVISQNQLTDRARLRAPSSRHISVDNFMNSPVYDAVVQEIKASQQPEGSPA